MAGPDVSNGGRTVIVVAYACSPEGLSEQWLGWKWVEMASESAKVHLVTRPNRPGLREVCEERGVDLHEVEVPKWIRKQTQGLGDAGMWIRVHAWARGVRIKIRELDESHEIAYGHVVTFHSVRMPYVFDGCGFLKVWGPASGVEYVPRPYLRWLRGARFHEGMRGLIARLARRRLAAKATKYDVMLYGNSQTREAVEERRKGICRVVLPNNAARIPGRFSNRSWSTEQELRLVFVGSCQERRGIPLLLEAMSVLGDRRWSLDIAGTGSALEYWKRFARERGLQDRVRFHGWVDKAAVEELYARSHLFAFPSLRDGGGSGMLEALERGVPVLALRWGGPADVIGETGAGVLFPVGDPRDTLDAIRQWFHGLFDGTFLYDDLARAVEDFDLERFSWRDKNEQLQSALSEVAQARQPQNSP